MICYFIIQVLIASSTDSRSVHIEVNAKHYLKFRKKSSRHLASVENSFICDFGKVFLSRSYAKKADKQKYDTKAT